MNSLHPRRSHELAVTTLLAIIIVAIGGTRAAADVNHWYAIYECPVAPGSDPQHPDVNDGTYWVVDLMVDISGGDDWTATQAEIVLGTCPDDGTFFEHALGDDGPPNPALFGYLPALEYDSFYTTPDSFPNPGSGHGPSFADIHSETCSKDATWFDTANTGDGTFLIARYTLHDESGLSCCVHLSGATTLVSTGGQLHYWGFWFPFPPATIHNVYPGGAGCYATIQDAVNAAADGEVVQLADGNFTGPGNRDVDFLGKAITVRSASGNPNACIIDCEGQGRAFQFVNDEGPTSRLEGVTITNGRVDSFGGAIRCGSHGFPPFTPAAHGSPTISNCRFINNEADDGGAIGCIENSEPVLSNCYFSGNSAPVAIGDGRGGAIYSAACAPTLTNCTFIGHTATNGGAIWCTGQLDLDYCTFIDNQTTLGFGAAIAAGGGSVTTSPAYTFDYCTFFSNVSFMRGSGLYLYGDYCWAAITNCTFCANASATGGVIFCDNGSTADILQTIIAFSTAGQAIECIPNGHATLTCSDVFGNEGGDWVGCIAGQESLRNNLWANPGFCDAAGGDLTLRSASPCTALNSPCGQLVGAQPEGCSGPAMYLVCPDGSGDFTDIQTAIEWALPGDVIELCDATFTGDGNRDIDYGGKAITIRSQSGNPEACVIDCQASDTDQHRGFHFHSGEGPDSVLEGVKVTGGYVDETPNDRGGAVACDAASSPTFINCVFSGNTAETGGAVACEEGASPGFTDCIIAQNSTTVGTGGGMVTSGDGAPTLTNCTFSYNTAGDDGGGLAAFSYVRLIDCTFEHNSSPNHGGGMTTMGITHDPPELTGCIFAYNSAGPTWGVGGGLSVFGYAGPLENCTFYGNTAVAAGGGMYIANMSDPTLTNCTFYGNSAPTGGGLMMDDSTTHATLQSTIVSFSTQGEGIYCGSGSAATLAGCCDVYGNAGGPGVCIQPQLGTAGNMALDPLFCDPASDDYTIRSDSPCAPFSSPNPECDLIGAWPVGCEAPGSLIGDLNCDGVVDFGDINPFVLRLTDPAVYAAQFPDCPDANGDIDEDGTVDFGDINPFVALLLGP